MYEEKKRTLTMVGEEMELLFDVDCLWESTKNIRLALPSIVNQLQKILVRDDIADCLISDVAIGNKVILIDRETDRSYRLERRVGTICVLRIYESILAESDTMSIVYIPMGNMIQLLPTKIREAA